MPEGPEVKLTCVELNKLMDNAKLTGIEVFHNRGNLGKDINEVKNTLFAPREYITYTGYAQCRGKLMSFYFENRHSSKSYHIICHMMLKGFYSVDKTANSLLQMNFDKDIDIFDDKNEFQNTKQVKLSVYYNDPMYISKWKLASNDEFLQEYRDLGPDIMYYAKKSAVSAVSAVNAVSAVSAVTTMNVNTTMNANNSNKATNTNNTIKETDLDIDTGFDTFKENIDKLRATRSKVPICQLLMNQQIISGIGNYLRSDIIYAVNKKYKLNIQPTDIFRDITDDVYRKIFYTALDVAKNSYDLHGHNTYNNLQGIPGSYIPVIYGRTVTDDGEKVKVVTCSDKRKMYIL